MRERALVITAAGDKYAAMLEVSAPLFRRYADRVGCDIVVLDRYPEFLTARYAKVAAGQELERYERIIVLDADILIADDCPDLFALVPEDHLGAYIVSEDTGFHDAGIAEFQRLMGDIGWRRTIFNSGVMVLSQQHRPLFDLSEPDLARWIEINGDGKSRPGPFMGYDQIYLNYRIQKLGMPVKDLGYRFNHTTVRDSKQRFASHIIHCKGHRPGQDRVTEMKRARFVLERPWLRCLFCRFPALVQLYDKL